MIESRAPSDNLDQSIIELLNLEKTFITIMSNHQHITTLLTANIMAYVSHPHICKACFFTHVAFIRDHSFGKYPFATRIAKGMLLKKKQNYRSIFLCLRLKFNPLMILPLWNLIYLCDAV